MKRTLTAQKLKGIVQGRLEDIRTVPGSEEVVEQLEQMAEFAAAHRLVVEKWGRYPHR